MMDLILQHVSKSYGDKNVLSDFSCRIPAGSSCAIMAPSGTGKTTLLRLILAIEKPDSGQITGIPLKKSAVFQEDRLCPKLSVLSNLRMAAPKCPASRLTAILEELGIADSAATPAEQLSGGMARRAALARALAYDGDLLALDEPFTGLDDAARLAAAETILRHRSGRTLLLITHREEDLSLLQAEQCIRL